MSFLPPWEIKIDNKTYYRVPRAHSITKAAATKKAKDLEENNKRMGEHYSVFDENEKEVYHGY